MRNCGLLVDGMYEVKYLFPLSFELSSWKEPEIEMSIQLKSVIGILLFQINQHYTNYIIVLVDLPFIIIKGSNNLGGDEDLEP